MGVGRRCRAPTDPRGRPPGVSHAQELTFGAIVENLRWLGVDFGNLCDRARDRVFSRRAEHMKPGSTDRADLRAIGEAALRGVMGALVD